MLSEIKWKGFLLPLIFGIGLWLVTPLRPVAISIMAWHLFAILWQRLLLVLPSHYR